MTAITVICGLPGTGKSTLAKALADAIGAIHLNTDRVRHDMGKLGQYSAGDKAAVYAELLKRTREALDKGMHVILDGTFSTRTVREAVLELGKRTQVPVRWIEVTASADTVRRRVSEKRPFTEADYAVYQKITTEFEPLPEDHLSLDSDVLEIGEMVHRARLFIESVST